MLGHYVQYSTGNTFSFKFNGSQIFLSSTANFMQLFARVGKKGLEQLSPVQGYKLMLSFLCNISQRTI